MKRVAELNDLECAIVYKKLSLEQKRTILIPIVGEEAQVYTDPALIRDILERYILPHLDLTTRSRLKQTCTYFAERIQVWPLEKLVHIRTRYDAAMKCETKDIFFPFLQRFLIDQKLCSKLASIARFKTNLHKCKTFRVSSDCIVHYPSGIVCKNSLKYPRGHIFQEKYDSFMWNGYVRSIPRSGRRFGGGQTQFIHLKKVLDKYN